MSELELAKALSYKEGAAAEQERIIELLKEHQPSELGRELGVYPCTCGYDSPDINLTQHHIALIKGESKQEYPQALPLPPKTPENTQPNWTGF